MRELEKYHRIKLLRYGTDLVIDRVESNLEGHSMNEKKIYKMKRMLLLSFTFYFFLIHAISAGDMFKKMPVDSGGSYYSIGPDSLKKMLLKKEFLFINVHIPYEGEIEGTDIFVPYNEIQNNLNKFPADKSEKIVLYCRSDRMSTIAAHSLVKLGYTNIWSLEGGMAAWKKAGFPLQNTRDTR
jgi:rhodanese-related sulfurtransferase